MREFEQTLRWIAIGSVYLLPFIVFYVATSLFFPFITGKNFAFRILVEIAATAWLALALVSPNYRPRRSWILAAFAAFVFILAIADAQGVNPFKSFWSNFERMDGWVTLAHLFAYLVVVVSVLNTENLWRRLFQLSLAVSVSVGFYGILQLAGFKAIGQGGAGGLSARLDATFGNAIYLAVYMLFHAFIAALLWAQEWNERSPGKRMTISVGYGSIIVFSFLILLLTGTRGTTLGILGGAALTCLIYIFRADNAQWARKYVFGAFAVVLVIAGLLWSVRDNPAIRNVGFLVRLANISLEDATVKSRFMNMGMAWQGFKEKPILGWGQENYAIVFDKYFDPRMYAAEPWFDRVHNTVFDWLIAGGLLGLVSYLAIFATALVALWRSRAFSVAEGAILIGLLAAYFFHNLFVFDNVTSYILFATIIGYITWRESEARNAPRLLERFSLPYAASPFTALGAIIVVGALGWYANAAAIGQNKLLIKALIDGSQGRYEESLTNFEGAIALNSAGTQEAREQLAQAATQIAGSNLPLDLKQRYFNIASQQMTEQANVSPLDARFPLFSGLLLEAYGDYNGAQAALQRAHELSPAKQSILYALAQNAISRNDAAAATAHFKTAYEVFPGNKDARLYYASILIRAGQDALADEILAPIIPTGEAADARIAAAYGGRGQYNKIVEVWKAYVAAYPEDPQGHFTLAAAYYAANETANAIKTLQEVGQSNPSVKAQADAYIEQIRNGTAPKPQ